METDIGRNYRQRLDKNTIFSFLNSLELNPSPEHFRLTKEYRNDLTTRELFNEAKRCSAILRSYINSLPQDKLIRFFNRKISAHGLDRDISEFFGIKGRFSQNGGKITRVEYQGRLLLYRRPRNLRSPHFVWRFTIKFPQTSPNTIYLKVYHKDVSFEKMHIELANSLGLNTNQIRYFPRDRKSIWIIQEEIQGCIQLYDVRKRHLEGIEEKIIMELAGHAAIGDVLRKYDRSFSNFLLTTKKRTGKNILYSIDNELLLGTRENCQIAYRKGKCEIFFLLKFPQFSSLEGKIRLISLFQKYYIINWRKIIKNKERLRKIISFYPVKIRQKALRIFNEEVKKDPYKRLKKMIQFLLGWELKQRYIKEWELLFKKKKDELLKDKVITDYLKRKDKNIYAALRILFNPCYTFRLKILELSISNKVLMAAKNMIVDVLKKYNSKALSALESLTLKKEDELSRVLSHFYV